MLPSNVDGRLQVTAAASLLDFSRLIRWDRNEAEFVPVPRETFEYSWRTSIDPVFGRVICWINFSAGAEFLAKGACLLNGVEVRVFPKKEGATPNYGDLADLYLPKNASLKTLCDKCGASDYQRQMLLDGYKTLATTIRNRDAHAYVPNVRDGHHHLVQDVFVECLNLLVSWLPGGARTVTRWRDEAVAFTALVTALADVTRFTQEDLEQILDESLSDLLTYDLALLQNDVSERAITHKLAEYLRNRIPHLDIDCEYNRNFELGGRAAKTVNIARHSAMRGARLSDLSEDELLAISTFPDIIVHRRLSNAENLLIVEVKKTRSTVSHDFDHAKLKAFTGSENKNNYRYRFGAFVLLETDVPVPRVANVIWFADGKELSGSTASNTLTH